MSEPSSPELRQPSGQSKSIKPKGFTLIELSRRHRHYRDSRCYSLPGLFKKCEENARRASCQSNEKQIGLAFIQYTQDADETLPVGGQSFFNCGTTFYEGTNWGNGIYPYAKSTGLYRCPDDTANAQEVSYVYNDSLSYPACTDGSGTVYGISGAISKIGSPANSVMLFESTGQTADVTSPTSVAPIGRADDTGGIGGAGKLATGPIDGENAADTAATPMGRHTNGANYLLADGHVKWLQGVKVSTGNPPASPTTPQGGGNAEGTQVGLHVVTFSPF